MRHQVPFARLLDDTLAAFTAEPPRPFRPPPVLGFFDFSSRSSEPVAFRTARPMPYVAAPRVEPRPVTVRKLSPRQQEALQQLVALGAPITIDFTRDDLRRAHRALAHAYHPDRHPGSSEAERARLATRFTRAQEAYKVLLIAVAEAA